MTLDPPDRAILMLDVDGVVNHWALYAARENDPAYANGDDTEWMDPVCVARVQAICDRTGAAIVISSSWRLIVGLARTTAALRAHGLTADVVGETPEHAHREFRVRRASEIRAWLAEHALVERWCVLDDESVSVDPDHFVRTHVAVGLTDADVERAVAILGAR